VVLEAKDAFTTMVLLLAGEAQHVVIGGSWVQVGGAGRRRRRSRSGTSVHGGDDTGREGGRGHAQQVVLFPQTKQVDVASPSCLCDDLLFLHHDHW